MVWMHPFLDGNGRVARLMSHAQLLRMLDTGAVWSVARGLARNVQDYKQMLANCDLPRRNDLDGRGALREEALGEFTEFFLKVCLDQVSFMESLMQPDRLRARILLWVEEEIRVGALPPKSGMIPEAILYRGELPRGEADTLLGTVNARPAASYRPSSAEVSCCRRAPARPCAWPSPQPWRHAGCRGCSRTSRTVISVLN